MVKYAHAAIHKLTGEVIISLADKDGKALNKLFDDAHERECEMGDEQLEDMGIEKDEYAKHCLSFYWYIGPVDLNANPVMLAPMDVSLHQVWLEAQEIDNENG